MGIYVGNKRYAPYIGDNRRRYMGGGGSSYDENSYIQDGLVFQLDGINKGSNQGYWTDLKGGVTFTIPASGVDVLDKGFEYTSKTYMPLASGTIPNDSQYTVEVCFYKKNGDTLAGIFNAKSGYASGTIMIMINNNANVFLQRQVTIKEKALVDTLSRYSYNLNVCCVNGDEGTFAAADYWTTTQVGVGAVYGGRGIIGIVHSIRIYNRQLTLAEMQFNQNIDLKRFGT